MTLINIYAWRYMLGIDLLRGGGSGGGGLEEEYFDGWRDSVWLIIIHWFLYPYILLSLSHWE